ncbi:MAG: hypothetical protein OHK0021_04250 [Bryobacter sp.]
MKFLLSIPLACLLAAPLDAEVYDRLAVSIGNEIITERDILLSLRTAAFLDGEPVRITPAEERQMAQRLVELTLIRLEIAANRYPLPTREQVDRAFATFKEQRFGQDENSFRQALAEYEISESDVRDSLEKQLVTLAFIEFRFRPAVQLSEEEISDYFRFEYLPELRRLKPDLKAPAYLEVRSTIVEILTQQRVDNLLDRWLSQTENQTRIQWNESVFENPTPLARGGGPQ